METPRRPAQRPPAAATTPEQIAHMRELFWHNVIREILTALSATRAAHPPPPPESKRPGPAHPGATDKETENLFDGRLAVITATGERIAIADVFPLFACGLDGPSHRAASLAVECTVFQIRTPDGQVITLPLHEIRAFHALSPELMRRLEELATRDREETGGPGPPFGFAAFRSLPGEEEQPPPDTLMPDLK